MLRHLSLALLMCLVAGCAGGPPPQHSGCILGDPSGSFKCQALTYQYAP